MPEREFDFPIYKVLARNETPASKGHQSGVLIPVDLVPFFPTLDATQAPPEEPSLDHLLLLHLHHWRDGEFLEMGTVRSRFQYQTRGGRRSPEYRITRNLVRRDGFLRGADEGDILVFERRLGTTNEYRVTYYHRDTAFASQLRARRPVGGIVSESESPIPISELEATAHEISSDPNADVLVDDGRDRQAVERARRSDAFRFSVRRAYNFTCSMCESGLRAASAFEVEAAHIIPVGEGGRDVIPNGLSLCRTHHWAFDAGLLWVDSDHRVHVAEHAKAYAENSQLAPLEGRPLALPAESSHWPSPKALRWHEMNISRPSE